VELFSGDRLPYVDNLVNLFVAEDLHGLSMDEVLRVVAPGGAACICRDGRWVTTAKPRPAAIDDWTHALYDASNNAVSRDTVIAPPQHFQWIAEPRYGRNHATLASVSVAVTAGSRFFYISDETPVASTDFPPEWQLVARDAFNGVLLWNRSIPTWENFMRGFRSGPPELSRRLVATGDRVYVTLGLDAPVAALDPATGQTLATYAGTEGTEEILYRDGTLYLVVGPAAAKKPEQPAWPAPKTKSSGPIVKTVMAVDAAAGRVRWKRSDAQPLPVSLAAGPGRVFWLDRDVVVCADAGTGADVWRAPRQATLMRPGWSAPTLVVQGNVVLCADRSANVSAGSGAGASKGKQAASRRAEDGAPGELVAYSATDGKMLWSAPCAEGFHSPVDVFVNDNLVWLGQSLGRKGPDFTAGLDLLTGEVQRRISPDLAYQTTKPHHRCYRDRATGRYLLVGRTGVEFIDTQTGEVVPNHWILGTCQYGIVPANGLLYVPPHVCACYMEAKLSGLLALAPDEGSGFRVQGSADEADASSRFHKGPAYAAALPPSADQPVVGARLPPSEEWPTYRHDPARSGHASTAVPAELKCAWQARLGGRLSAPVIADGRVLVSSIDAHTVYALDARDGKLLWQYTAAGRVDSPPTLAEGLAVFGSADGWVHCLRAADGQLVWRYRVAPEERRLMAYGQLESAWPISGSVLVRDGSVYCDAGRSSYIEGGIRLARLDLKTGRLLAEHRVWSPDPQTGLQPANSMHEEMPGALPDVLSSEAGLIYMRHLAFDAHDLQPRSAPAHLYSSVGFLDDTWWHRTYWIYGQHFYCGSAGWFLSGHETPAGRLLAIDEGQIFGFGYKPAAYSGGHARMQYHLFGIDRRTMPPQPPANVERAKRDYGKEASDKVAMPPRWARDLPLLARAMVLTGDKLLLAGPPSSAVESRSVYEGAQGAILCVASTAGGKTLVEYQLDAVPVLDGLAAAQGRLYMTLRDGRLLCLGDRRTTLGGTELQRLPESTK